MARRLTGLLPALAIAPLLSGCVERRFLVESNPPGAMVYVNNVAYGATPIDVPFTYYGTYNVTLVKDGYQTRHYKQRIDPPWYQYPPIDFFSESVWPFQVTDSRSLFYELDPVIQPNVNQIKAEAEELRRRAMSEIPEPRYPELNRKRELGDSPGPAPRVAPAPPVPGVGPVSPQTGPAPTILPSPPQPSPFNPREIAPPKPAAVPGFNLPPDPPSR